MTRIKKTIMSVRTSSLAEIQQLIHARTILQPGAILGIDGMDGSGKSYLANQLATLIFAIHVNLDEFLNPNQDGFLGHLRYDELHNAIRHAMDKGPVIVEGCCLRNVIDRLALDVNLHIYVKYLVNGYWQSHSLFKTCCAMKTIDKEEEILRKLNDLSGDPIKPDKSLLSAFRRELIIYHFQYRPHEQANFIYERSEYPGGPELSG